MSNAALAGNITATDEARRFRILASTRDVDRDGDRVLDWKLDAFRSNPVILFAHQHDSLPVARAEHTRVTDAGLEADIVFPPRGLSAEADAVAGLVEHGFLRSVSVGFRPSDAKPNDHGGFDYPLAEVFEVSLVPIPANADAKILHQIKGGPSWIAASIATKRHGGVGGMLSLAQRSGLNVEPITKALRAGSSPSAEIVKAWAKTGRNPKAPPAPKAPPDPSQAVVAVVDGKQRTELTLAELTNLIDVRVREALSVLAPSAATKPIDASKGFGRHLGWWRTLPDHEPIRIVN